jgi:CheY-like chemotaxis protein
MRSRSDSRRNDVAHPHRKAQAPGRDAHQSLSSRLLKAQDDERRRISRELHDSVGQSLAAVKMNLEQVAKLLPHGGQAREGISACIETVDRASNEVRTVSYLLHPPTLDLVGLSSAIKWYADGFSKRSGIVVTVEIPENLPRLTSSCETALFRVVQESLSNVHKYSEASKASILISLGANELQLEVHDNGQGIAESKLPEVAAGAALGVGIPGMRERLSELGGRLEIQSGDSGTTIIAVLPISYPMPAELEPAQSVPHVTANRLDVGGSHRVLIVDDHELMRRGLRSLLKSETSLAICGEATSATDAIDKVGQLKPDLILLDLKLPDDHAWRVIREIQKLQDMPKIIVLTAYDYPGIEETVRRAQCDGFVNKSEANNELLRAIRIVLNGGSFFRSQKTAAAAT